VGRVTRSNPGLLELLAANRYLPVVACVAGDRAGNIYNGERGPDGGWPARRLSAPQQLIFLTDVAGVLDGFARGAACCSLPTQARALVAFRRRHRRHAGQSSMRRWAAIEAGIVEVRIAPGAADRVLMRILEGDALGTRLAPFEVARPMNQRSA